MSNKTKKYPKTWGQWEEKFEKLDLRQLSKIKEATESLQFDNDLYNMFDDYAMNQIFNIAIAVGLDIVGRNVLSNPNIFLNGSQNLALAPNINITITSAETAT